MLNEDTAAGVTANLGAALAAPARLDLHNVGECHASLVHGGQSYVEGRQCATVGRSQGHTVRSCWSRGSAR